MGWDPTRPAPEVDDLVSCVACGLCLPHCPTFRLTGRETASPRGRVAAMRAVDEGEAARDAGFATMMDECLACRACETACPSGVPFGRMIEAARAQVEPTRPVRTRLLKRLGLVAVLGHRPLLRLAALGLAAAQLARLDRLLPGAGDAPRVSVLQLLRPLPRSVGSGPPAALMTGCVMHVAFRDVHRATMELIALAGHTAVIPPGGGCCGALAAHYGHPETARDLARARIAQLERYGLIVVNSAGCSAHMKHYGELLGDDAEWAARAARVAARTVDAIELQPTATTEVGRVAVHDACHHVNGPPIAERAHEMLRAAGAEPCSPADDGRCCGAAGAYALSQPELSARLRKQKAQAIIATGAPMVAVSNPGCAAQIERGLREARSDATVAHPAQLLVPRRKPGG